MTLSTDALAVVVAAGGAASSVWAYVAAYRAARATAEAQHAVDSQRLRLHAAVTERLVSRHRNELEPVPDPATTRSRCCGCTWDNHSHVLVGSPCLDCPDCVGWLPFERPNPTRSEWR
jgi:hypothetical protein